MPPPNPLDISDLTGGVADGNPMTMGDNEVVEAWDVDFWATDFVGRRNGCTVYKSGFGTPLYGLFIHTPTSNRDDDLLMAVRDDGAWYQITTGDVQSAITVSPADTPWLPRNASTFAGGGVDAVSIHGKFFVAIKNGVDRLHVFDGTTLRRTGLAAAAVPTVANTGAGTYPATIRYYKVRYTTQSGGVTLRRSEASASVSFTPSGAGTAARVTKPATVTEGETHWELYASPDNANFYRIATTVVGTTTYDDSADPLTYATAGPLDEDIGDYTLQRSARWLTTDNDRLILGGAFEDAAFDSRVQWTQLLNQTGVGNDERVPTDVSNYIDLDAKEGGGLTALKAFEGGVVAFKFGRIYTLVRSGLNSQAYVLGAVIRTHGALPYSVVQGKDQNHRNALYFLDSADGPTILGAQGVRSLISDKLQRQWRATVNLNAHSRITNAVYYPNKGQVWWHISTGILEDPTVRWMYNIATGGVTFHTLPVATYAVTIWKFKPYVAQIFAIVGCDDSAATSDYGTNYRAYIKSKAYPIGGIVKRGGIERAVIQADPSTGVTLTLKLIRDYNKESRSFTFSLTAAGAEDTVTIPMDQAQLADCMAFQFEIGDASAVSVAAWQLHRITFVLRSEGRT